MEVKCKKLSTFIWSIVYLLNLQKLSMSNFEFASLWYDLYGFCGFVCSCCQQLIGANLVAIRSKLNVFYLIIIQTIGSNKQTDRLLPGVLISETTAIAVATKYVTRASSAESSNNRFSIIADFPGTPSLKKWRIRAVVVDFVYRAAHSSRCMKIPDYHQY